MKKNRRIQSFALLILAAVLLAVIAVLGSFWQEAALGTDFTRKNLAPCIQYPFGTDWMGRDIRSCGQLRGLSLVSGSDFDGGNQREIGFTDSARRSSESSWTVRCGCLSISSWEFPICCF